tara:strand:- start:200 stop:325 length:126 start_codon:yes stop_codon:yes gene_type:complete
VAAATVRKDVVINALRSLVEDVDLMVVWRVTCGFGVRRGSF